MAQPRYQVIERIDAGGMAEVFKARSTSLHGLSKVVAIKRVLPNLTKNERFVRMFLDEAKVSLFLNHTNVVQVFDLGIADGTYFIVMEYIDGTNLKNFMEEHRTHHHQIPIEQAVYVATEICKGLSHAHQKVDAQGQDLDIVHRDISPPNVLLSREGEVKITDFGLAKAKSQVEHTDPGVVKGKFGYLSPEAAHGEDIDERTDIFAVGIVLWEMLTGQRLFQGKTDFDTLQQVRRARVEPVSQQRSEIPPQLDQILQRALAPDLSQRYATAEQLGRDLASFLFAFGRPVSAFDIANQVQQIMRLVPSKPKAPQDTAIQEAVQKQVNEIMSLEEIDDLDRFMTQTYGDIGVESGGTTEGSVVNTALSELWDEEFGDEAGDFEIAALHGGLPHQSDHAPTWQEGSLAEVRKATRAIGAISERRPSEGNDEEPTQQMSRDQITALRPPASHHRDQPHGPTTGRIGTSLPASSGAPAPEEQPLPALDAPLQVSALSQQNETSGAGGGSLVIVGIIGVIVLAAAAAAGAMLL